MKEEEEQRRQGGAIPTAAPQNQEPVADIKTGRGLVVAHLSADAMKNVKLKDILNPVKHVVNAALPLVEAPPLHEVRRALLAESPYAVDAIDFALADLVGRTAVHLRPLLFHGEVGSGKTLFGRRLGELLGLSVWRTAASRSDGATFGGTDRRWPSP